MSSVIEPWEQGFWDRVDSSPGPDACWQWTGAVQGRGGAGRPSDRGRFYLRGRNLYAYRVAFELTHRVTIPSTVLACHRCDNPACVNPSHIFLGSHLDNMSDAARKGRLNGRRCLAGEGHPAATRPDADVDEARRLFATGEWQKAALARRFGVGGSTMSRWLAMEVRTHHLPTPEAAA